MSTAAPQSLLRSCSIPATVRSSTGQPMVYSTRRPRLPCSGAVFKEVRWSMTSWEAPAPSMLTSRSVRHPAGIWANDAVNTAR